MFKMLGNWLLITGFGWPEVYTLSLQYLLCLEKDACIHASLVLTGGSPDTAYYNVIMYISRNSM